MISMNDFRSQDEDLIKSELEAIERVIRSGWWILGSEVESFEVEWAAWLGVPFAVGCGNGMDAIEIGLRALGIGEGDEVITTPMTAFATVLAIYRCGATPVLADISSDSAMLEPASVERCITPKTKAVILVHLYGRLGPVQELLKICNANSISLIEDCAQAHGAKSFAGPAGSFGRFAAWSFYPTKNLGAIGDGGALTSAHSEIIDTAKSLRNYGQSVRYQHPLIGMNSRLDEVQAAILRVRLQNLTKWTELRRLVAYRYSQEIHNPQVKVLPLPKNRNEHVHHLFVVTHPERDKLQEHLKNNGIETLIHYPIPIHHQEPCKNIQMDPHGLKKAEEHALQCLSLPCHPGLSMVDVDQVITAINGFRVQ
jgi:dTDP-4-amino-4,6-dideoxygalactose transaminase